MKKYSVLMSLYLKEQPQYLQAAIQSMIDQSYQPNEIVIVKDGLVTKELEEVLDRYCDLYPRLFRIIGYEKNRGLGYALQYGLAYCQNELIARMDTDDIALYDRCKQQVELFDRDSALDIVGGDIEEFVENINNKVSKRVVPRLDHEIKEYMKYRCPFNHMSVMFKKSAVIKAGGYLDWFWNEDYYLWLRMLQINCKMANTGTILVNVRVGKDMYKRRGGSKYFVSEFKIQKYMLDQNIINFYTFIENVVKRFIVQIVLPDSLRSWVFKHFARE